MIGSREKAPYSCVLHFAKVKLNPPKRKQLPPVTVWAVYAREIDYSSEVKSPIEWMLLTTVAVCNFEEAAERLAWYACRWGIEVYRRTLKSGCRIEDRRLNNADRIEACLAIDLVVAWRIYWLTKQGRETPDIPCDIFLSEDERFLIGFNSLRRTSLQVKIYHSLYHLQSVPPVRSQL